MTYQRRKLYKHKAFHYIKLNYLDIIIEPLINLIFSNSFTWLKQLFKYELLKKISLQWFEKLKKKFFSFVLIFKNKSFAFILMKKKTYFSHHLAPLLKLWRHTNLSWSTWINILYIYLAFFFILYIRYFSSTAMQMLKNKRRNKRIIF